MKIRLLPTLVICGLLLLGRAALAQIVLNSFNGTSVDFDYDSWTNNYTITTQLSVNATEQGGLGSNFSSPQDFSGIVSTHWIQVEARLLSSGNQADNFNVVLLSNTTPGNQTSVIYQFSTANLTTGTWTTLTIPLNSPQHGFNSGNYIFLGGNLALSSIDFTNILQWQLGGDYWPAPPPEVSLQLEFRNLQIVPEPSLGLFGVVLAATILFTTRRKRPGECRSSAIPSRAAASSLILAASAFFFGLASLNAAESWDFTSPRAAREWTVFGKTIQKDNGLQLGPITGNYAISGIKIPLRSAANSNKVGVKLRLSAVKVDKPAADSLESENDLRINVILNSLPVAAWETDRGVINFSLLFNDRNEGMYVIIMGKEPGKPYQAPQPLGEGLFAGEQSGAGTIEMEAILEPTHATLNFSNLDKGIQHSLTLPVDPKVSSDIRRQPHLLIYQQNIGDSEGSFLLEKAEAL